ncbi:MAG TPA: M56 family metallopeptidase, partial [Pirellulaceae bacterium]|nr:M56 family metallopeptidase [Pirellulaceae bacterium]
MLAHELAHLRRYDHLFNLVQRVIESLLFFHPAVWWVSQRVREEREQCCDDLVVACGATPLDYARSLLRVAELSRLAERRQAVRPSLAAASLFATGDQPSKLRQRIARLLDDSRDSRESHVRLRQRWPVVVLVAVCCVLVVVVANTGWHWANEAWAGFSADERQDVKTEAGLGQPSNPAATQAKEPAAATAPPDGLEFLKPYPKLHGLSLDMTEPKFLEIVKPHKLKIRKTTDGGKVAHQISLGDGHTLIVMFDEAGKCRGIQRLRGELAEQPEAEPKKTGEPIMLRQPSVLLPDHWIVQSVALDRADREIVTASNQSFITIRRWDRASLKLISEIKLQGDKHGRSVRHETLRFSGDRRRVIAATDAYVGIWDATTGQLLKRLPFPAKEGIYDCAIDLLDCTPDLSLIVGHRALPGRLTLSYDAHLIVWDGATGDVLRTVIDPGATDLKSLDLSTDGKRLVTTNGNGAKVWETSTGKLLRFIPNDNSGRNHSDPDVSSQYTNHVWSVRFSPDGKLLATGDILGVNLIDADTGKLVRHIEGPYRYSSSMSPGLIFSPDGRWLARLGTQEAVDEKADAKRGAKVEKSGDAKTDQETDRKSDEKKRHRYVVPVWSTETGARHFELHTEANDAQFSGDGRELAVVFSDMQQALSLWTLSGEAAGVEKPAGPGPHSRQDRVEENGHHVGKKAAEYVEQFKPTWGVAQDGLQYGVALTAPRRQLRAGERVPLVAFFRNAGDKPIKFNTAPDFFGNSPQIVNAKGESLALENIPLLGHVPHYHEKLEPGEVLGPFYMSFGLGDNPRP